MACLSHIQIHTRAHAHTHACICALAHCLLTANKYTPPAPVLHRTDDPLPPSSLSHTHTHTRTHMHPHRYPHPQLHYTVCFSNTQPDWTRLSYPQLLPPSPATLCGFCITDTQTHIYMHSCTQMSQPLHAHYRTYVHYMHTTTPSLHMLLTLQGHLISPAASQPDPSLPPGAWHAMRQRPRPVRVCACVCVCARARVRACVRVCARACVYV